MKIKEYLEEYDISRQDFAAVCGITIHTLNNIILGRATTLVNALKIHQITNKEVSLLDLVSDELLKKKGIDKEILE